MMIHIDVSSVLRQTVSCELYSNLVTRPTGAAVRTQIEALLGDSRERSLTVIDFSHVGMIDFSCADEVIAKLLLRYGAAEPPLEAYFVVRGVRDAHLDAIESVLERYGLALVVQCEGAEPQLVGSVEDGERRTWQMLSQLGRAAAGALHSGGGHYILAVDWINNITILFNYALFSFRRVAIMSAVIENARQRPGLALLLNY